MRKISEVTITLGRTINVGHFESFRCDISMTEKFGPGEYNEGMYEDLRADVEEKLEAQIKRIVAR